MCVCLPLPWASTEAAKIGIGSRGSPKAATQKPLLAVLTRPQQHAVHSSVVAPEAKTLACSKNSGVWAAAPLLSGHYAETCFNLPFLAKQVGMDTPITPDLSLPKNVTLVSGGIFFEVTLTQW